jgi:hypothetical protein
MQASPPPDANLIYEFEVARDKATEEIVALCGGGGSLRYRVRGIIRDAFQPILVDVLKRYDEVSTNENAAQVPAVQSLHDVPEYSP